MKKTLIIFLCLCQLCLVIADITLAIWFVPFLLFLQCFIIGYLIKNRSKLNLTNAVTSLASGLFILFGAHLAWYIAAEFALKKSQFSPPLMWGVQGILLVISILLYLKLIRKKMV